LVGRPLFLFGVVGFTVLGSLYPHRPVPRLGAPLRGRAGLRTSADSWQALRCPTGEIRLLKPPRWECLSRRQLLRGSLRSCFPSIAPRLRLG